MNLKTTLQIVLGIILIALVWVYVVKPQIQLRKDYAELVLEHKKQTIANATLEKTAEGQFSMIADNTKTIEQLREDNDLLKNQDPIIIEKIVLQPAEIVTEPAEVIITDTTVEMIDYYPNESSWFIRYKSSVDLQDEEKTFGIFSFQPLKLDIMITEEPGGIFKAHLETADFIEVSVLDVQTLDLVTPDQIPTNNFGWLVGGGFNKNLNTKELNLEVMGGFRYKKVNIFGTINTDEVYGVKTLIEL